jgi:signal transduction histidine kinase
MKRAWLAWLVFGFCTAAVLAIMAWGSRRLVQAEENERTAKQEASLEESVRLSLWRMDTALAAIVIQENSRPYAGYVDDAAAPGSPYVKQHFELGPDGELTPPGAIAGLSQRAALHSLSGSIPKDWIRVEQSEKSTPVTPAATTAQVAPLQQLAQLQQSQTVQVTPTQSQGQRNMAEFQARETLNPSNAPPLPKAPRTSHTAVEIRTGALAPIWLGDELILARHVQVGSRDTLQACWMDWPKVRSALLGSVEDLLPGSDLIPQHGAFDPAEGRTLTSLPLRLVPARTGIAGGPGRSPILFSLRIAWVCMMLAIVSSGLLLMGAMSLSQRRAAFVSSVTHELRSPLTTFRMYTEMLVDGMATDPAKQSQYLETLYRESNRLVHLVENVLSYARLEKGRYGERETVSVREVIDRTRERLTEHARFAGMQLLVAVEPSEGQRLVRTDVSAIERILFNLVDNSCKYARSKDPRIHLEVSSDDRWAKITVRDHGPGIDPRGSRRLFQPFRKTAAEAARSAPGVGIGLSLSRRLAKAAGGRLEIVECEDGACLRLAMPLSPPGPAGPG